VASAPRHRIRSHENLSHPVTFSSVRKRVAAPAFTWFRRGKPALPSPSNMLHPRDLSTSSKPEDLNHKVTKEQSWAGFVAWLFNSI